MAGRRRLAGRGHNSTDDHDAYKRALGRGLDRLEPAEVDLERVLVGVERVVLTQRELVRDAEQRWAVARDQRFDAPSRLVRLGMAHPPAVANSSAPRSRFTRSSPHIASAREYTPVRAEKPAQIASEQFTSARFS